MSKNIRWHHVAAPLFTGVIALSAYGCDKASELQGDLCCKDFVVGADLSNVDFGIEGEAGLQYKALLQGVGDLSAVATATVEDVANACQAIAIDLGTDPKAVTAIDPAERAKGWCASAVASIKAEFSAGLTISAQPPSCSIDVSAQASCEAKCSGDANCEIQPGEIEASCEPGQVAVKCEGSCTAQCEGSANLAVECEGKCEGTCEGECAGGTNEGGNCTGECKGTCRGTCTAKAGAKLNCAGECKGGCEGTATAPKCKGKYTPPEGKCEVKAECKGSCDANLKAKAECRPGSIEIVAKGDGAAKLAAIGSLKLNLPKIFAVAQVKGKLLVEASGTLAASAQGTASIAGDLSVKAAACIVPTVDAVTKAGANIGASLEASASVVATVQGG